MERLGAPLARAHAVVPFEAEGEIERVFKTDLFGDVSDGLLGEFEELAGAEEALVFEVALWGLASLGTKEVGEAGEGEAALARDIRDSERLGEMGADVIEGAADARIDPRGGVFGIGKGAA